MMLDTDVLIWYFRGNKKAKQLIDKLGEFSISTIVYMEILQGIRNKQELRQLKRFIVEQGIECINLNDEICARATYFLEEFVLGHGLRMADALIAATTDIYGETLITGNMIHYRMIPNLSLKKFNPGT